MYDYGDAMLDVAMLVGGTYWLRFIQKTEVIVELQSIRKTVRKPCL